MFKRRGLALRRKVKRIGNLKKPAAMPREESPGEKEVQAPGVTEPRGLGVGQENRTRWL